MRNRGFMGLVGWLCVVSLIGSLGAESAAGKEKIKIILDTDIAGDIDDAFAQALVQISDEFEVLGITVAYGPTERRAKVSCKMLYDCGQEEIPVAVGRPKNPEDQPQLYWAEGFEKLKPIKQSAADFIIANLRKYPGQVTVISVGPVTNLADVIDKDPEAWKMVKEVYSMFGSFKIGYGLKSPPTNEYNVRADVDAAQKFMQSGVKITLAGLDVTTMVKFKSERRLQILLRRSPLTDSLCGLYSLWSSGRYGNDPTLFDPVAVAMAAVNLSVCPVLLVCVQWVLLAVREAELSLAGPQSHAHTHTRTHTHTHTRTHTHTHVSLLRCRRV